MPITDYLKLYLVGSASYGHPCRYGYMNRYHLYYRSDVVLTSMSSSAQVVLLARGSRLRPTITFVFDIQQRCFTPE
jgi:hypothetical protein